ncbi:hypothetical protein BD770DRAFT_449164 [Pilaira anomala]|nr:hypothetical protein BD770DRAFT_449164 [Pilaira anomala]
MQPATPIPNTEYEVEPVEPVENTLVWLRDPNLVEDLKWKSEKQLKLLYDMIKRKMDTLCYENMEEIEEFHLEIARTTSSLEKILFPDQFPAKQSVDCIG